MAYDPNSWQAQMGALGEEIVKRFCERFENCVVQKPDDTFTSGASIVDFQVFPKRSPGYFFFLEVKVQSAFLYGVEKAPTYSFPVAKINAYIAYGKQHKAVVKLYVVDPTAGLILPGILYVPVSNSSNASPLMKKRKSLGREYPFEQYSKALDGTYIYFHRKNFITPQPLNAEDRQKLLALSQNKTAYTGEITPEIAPALPDTATVEEQAALELTPPQKQTKQNTGTESNIKSLIDQFAVAVGVTRQDLKTAIVEIREKQFNCEMEALRAMLA